METAGKRVLLFGLVIVCLVLSGITLAPAARKNVNECIQACNDNELNKGCKDSCRDEAKQCRDECAELPGNPDQGGSPAARCVAACDEAQIACNQTCTDFLTECKSKCQPKDLESPSEPV